MRSWPKLKSDASLTEPPRHRLRCGSDRHLGTSTTLHEHCGLLFQWSLVTLGGCLPQEARRRHAGYQASVLDALEPGHGCSLAALPRCLPPTGCRHEQWPWRWAGRGSRDRVCTSVDAGPWGPGPSPVCTCRARARGMLGCLSSPLPPPSSWLCTTSRGHRQPVCSSDTNCPHGPGQRPSPPGAHVLTWGGSAEAASLSPMSGRPAS